MPLNAIKGLFVTCPNDDLPRMPVGLISKHLQYRIHRGQTPPPGSNRDKTMLNRGKLMLNRGKLMLNRGKIVLNRGIIVLNRGIIVLNRGIIVLNRG